MVFHTMGLDIGPTVVLLHGAGLSAWAYRPIAERLADEYRIVLPVIDGYAEAADQPFESIEASAQNLLNWIDAHLHGHVYALGGLSLGAQIVVEALGRRPDVADYAWIESALVCPMPLVAALAAPMARMSYGLIRREWFARQQARAMCVPEAMFPDYFRDSCKLSLQSFIHTLRSNATYRIPAGLAQCRAKALVLAGMREPDALYRSAQLLCKTLPHSLLWLEEGKHGEFCLQQPEDYANLLWLHLTGGLLQD